VGLFWDFQSGDPVDPRLEPAVGKVTYGAAYTEQTTEFFRVAKEARDELESQENVKVELWANLEAFEPGAGVACGSFSDIQRTDKARLDRGITFAQGYPSKLISFMWDGPYTCQGGQSTTLAEEIEADASRPILTQAFQFASGGKDGITVRGYHIADAPSVSLSWYDAAWAVQSKAVAVDGNGWVNAAYGQSNADVPDAVQELWVPFDWTNMAPSFWVHVNVTSGGKKATHQYSIGY
jgi:hypothetical protein